MNKLNHLSLFLFYWNTVTSTSTVASTISNHKLAERQESDLYYTAPCLPTGLGNNVALCCDSSIYAISSSYLGYDVASCQDDNFGACLSQYVSDVCVWTFPLGSEVQQGSTAGCGDTFSQYLAADLTSTNYCNSDGSLSVIPSTNSNSGANLHSDYIVALSMALVVVCMGLL
jgi:hypothetical protein